MSRSMAALQIDVYSDVICPWCYVGKRRLERALRHVSAERQAQVVWRPFQLNPTMPKGGMDRTLYLKAKFGSLDVFGTMEAHLLSAGEAEGIAFTFAKVARTPNTFLAHRLIWYAGKQGCQDALVELLFRGYFEEGLNIEDLATLIRVAGLTGLEPNETESFLLSEAGGIEVKAEEEIGQRMGIQSVPHFILDGKHAISGAQPPEVFLSAFQRIEGDRAEN